MTDTPIDSFDPALTGSAEDGIYGIATDLDSAALVYLPVPWEVTTSYGSGTSRGPKTILRASPQLDLYIRGLPDHYLRGFHLLDEDEVILSLNQTCKPLAQKIQSQLESSGTIIGIAGLEAARAQVNDACEQVNQRVYESCKKLDKEGKLVGLVGGDHSSPLGLIRYISEKYQGGFGVLHIDAHHDLRDAYQGFDNSHASIMHNVMALPDAPEALVQIGIRDFCQEEAELAASHPRITAFYDDDIKEALYNGSPFAAVVDQVVKALPERVYISFDIDGLRPDLCPHTGTPVAGGLEFEQAQFLLKTLVKAGKKIVGFDLCEVCPNPENSEDEWDGNVAARILFLLSSWMMESQVQPGEG